MLYKCVLILVLICCNEIDYKAYIKLRIVKVSQLKYLISNWNGKRQTIIIMVCLTILLVSVGVLGATVAPPLHFSVPWPAYSLVRGGDRVPPPLPAPATSKQPL